MIGFFDSGFGGLTVLREVIKKLPDYDYAYLGDNARNPYGTRTQEEIYQFTLEGVDFLFGQGAELVILACNTSSSSALRRIQQEFIPRFHPDRRVLGIIIPTAEDFGNFTKTGALGVLATPVTVESGTYLKEAKKYWPEVAVFQQACPLLVPLIERGESRAKLEVTIKEYLQALFGQSNRIDAVILGCTHYAIIERQIAGLVPAGVRVISQGEIIADKLQTYLQKHTEIENRLRRNHKVFFYTTGEVAQIEKVAEMFYGGDISFHKISLPDNNI